MKIEYRRRGEECRNATWPNPLKPVLSACKRFSRLSIEIKRCVCLPPHIDVLIWTSYLIYLQFKRSGFIIKFAQAHEIQWTRHGASFTGGEESVVALFARSERSSIVSRYSDLTLRSPAIYHSALDQINTDRYNHRREYESQSQSHMRDPPPLPTY